MSDAPDDDALRTIRAAVEAIVPSVDGRPGAADLGVERHVVRSVEGFLPGFVDLLTTLLDAYAPDVRPGARFAELDQDERRRVLRIMSEEDAPDLQDCIDGLLIFAYGGMYSEWTGYDRATGRLAWPEAWSDIGHLGPSDGHRSYRRER
jgi:hypothetical protein